MHYFFQRSVLQPGTTHCNQLWWIKINGKSFCDILIKVKKWTKTTTYIIINSVMQCVDSETSIWLRTVYISSDEWVLKAKLQDFLEIKPCSVTSSRLKKSPFSYLSCTLKYRFLYLCNLCMLACTRTPCISNAKVNRWCKGALMGPSLSRCRTTICMNRGISTGVTRKR